ALSFSFFSNSAPVCKRLLIKRSFQSDIPPAVRVCNADTASRHHDPNAPENRRTLTLPDNLPETKQALAEGVTRGIDALYHAGEI
ncbi:hypothetical protein ACSLOE_30130, partial [Escherichia coli]